MSVIRKLWFAVTGRKEAETPPPVPPVVIHDPDAHRPHDLDDPFFDRDVQARVADVIAHAAHRK